MSFASFYYINNYNLDYLYGFEISILKIVHPRMKINPHHVRQKPIEVHTHSEPVPLDRFWLFPQVIQGDAVIFLLFQQNRMI